MTKIPSLPTKVAQFLALAGGLWGCADTPEPALLNDAKQVIVEEPAPPSHLVRHDPVKECLLVEHHWLGLDSNNMHSISVCLDEKQYRQALDNHGVPAESLEFSYQSHSELVGQIAQRNAKLSETGFRFVESKGNVELRIDYPLATQLALEHMSAIRNAILTASHAHTGSDREQVEVLAAFVQSMNLFEPPATRTSSAGTILYTAKSTHPVETLVLGGGDCDSLTLLFESLVRAGSSVDLAYLGTIIQGQRHLFAGVGVPPEEGDLIVGVGDSMLVVYELTSRNSSKLLSDSSRKALLSSDVEVFLVGPSRLSSSTER